MIRTLRLENYRSFKEYELRDLARVNLLVGPNDCGKTSVLEAVELLASRGDPRVLVESMRRRGEFHVTPDGRGIPQYPVNRQFHGHAISPGSQLSISSDDSLGRVRIDVVEGWPDDSRELPDAPGAGLPPLALRIGRGNGERENLKYPLTRDGSLAWDPSAPGRPPHSRELAAPPAHFVTAESLRTPEMPGLWNQGLVEGPESFGNASHGSGMRRLSAVSESLARAAGGLLLIDEIDTGLHWTVMEEMWKLVVETAMESSVQVFATTHSLDCIIGLASLLRDRPDLAEAVSIQKIERRLDHGVSFGPRDIIIAAGLRIELR